MRITSSQSGSTFITVIILAAVILVIITSMMTRFMSDLSLQKRISLSDTAEMLKITLSSTLDNDQAFLRMMQMQPGAFSCLTAGAVCPNAESAPIAVQYANGTQLVGTGPSDGLRVAVDTTVSEPVASCSTFDPVNGSDECPFKYVVTWKPDCPAGACPPTELGGPLNLPIKPDIQVIARLQFRVPQETQRNSLRPDRFDFAFIRGKRSGTLASYCSSVGGIYDQTTEKCRMLKNNPTAASQGYCGPNESQYGSDSSGSPICLPRFACRPFYFLKGFLPSGEPVCEPTPMLGKRCPQNQAVIGINTNGEFLCGTF